MRRLDVWLNDKNRSTASALTTANYGTGGSAVPRIKHFHRHASYVFHIAGD